MISSNSLINKKERRFQSLVLLTIIVVYLLILAGGIVRSTGSGMGCPDWPKCFGRWVPPTEISQLPPDYQEIYGAKLKGEVEFNAVKTWIEYANRLLGALSGFLVLTLVISSFSYLRKDKAVVLGSVVAFLLIGANGWLGSRVVATELAQYMITLHLLLAILVVFALLFVYIRSRTGTALSAAYKVVNNSLRWLIAIIMVLTLGQIVLGAQVRDALDAVVNRLGYLQRDKWISNLNWTFYVHRSFSLVILAFHVIVIYQLRRIKTESWIDKLSKTLIVLVLMEIATGIIMAYLGVPAIAQPIHLVLAILLVGLQFSILLLLTPTLIMPKNINSKPSLLEV